MIAARSRAGLRLICLVAQHAQLACPKRTGCACSEAALTGSPACTWQGSAVGNCLAASGVRGQADGGGPVSQTHRSRWSYVVGERVTGHTRPIPAERRNSLAHGDPFDGRPTGGLLEPVRALIDVACRHYIAEGEPWHPTGDGTTALMTGNARNIIVDADLKNWRGWFEFFKQGQTRGNFGRLSAARARRHHSCAGIYGVA